jgi:Flp pilus assembly protein TadB
MKSSDSETPIDLNESEKPGVRTLVHEVAHVVREDLSSAGKEVKHKEVQAGIGVGLFGATGIFAISGIACLSVAAIAGLDVELPMWAAALIAAAITFALAGISALVGKKEVTQAIPPTPSSSLGKLKHDLKDIKDRATQ